MLDGINKLNGLASNGGLGVQNGLKLGKEVSAASLFEVSKDSSKVDSHYSYNRPLEEDFAAHNSQGKDTNEYDNSYSEEITGKDGRVREGKVVKNLPKVKAENVEKFLNSIKSMGLGIKAEDIMSSKGLLNPNFKVDENGNIEFKDLKSYIEKRQFAEADYFESVNGDWVKPCLDRPALLTAEIQKESYGDSFGKLGL